MVRIAFLSLLAVITVGETPVGAQDAFKNLPREPLVVDTPDTADGGAALRAACARERREREKRRAQGLPVGPVNRVSPCRSLQAPELSDRYPRVVKTPLRLPFEDPAKTNRDRRIRKKLDGDP